MTCTPIQLPNGARAIVCGPRQPRKKCACGRPATLLCDWKIPGAEEYALVKAGTVTGTCDRPLCDQCTHSPAPEKDLCPKHRDEWLARQRQGRLL